MTHDTLLKSIRALALVCFLPVVAWVPSGRAASPAPASYDVVVVGGTPAGVSAAIAAARAGKSAIIIEQSPVLGGALSSGVLRLDDQYVESNSGLMEEFRQRVGAYHRTVLADDPVVQAHVRQNPRQRWNTADGRAWEPRTAARIFAEMVGEVKGITTHFNEVAIGVRLAGDKVTGVVTRERDNQGRLGATREYAGRVIIDATYEADLAAYAGVAFRIGREARSVEEPHAGKIYTDFFRNVPSVLSGTILPGSTGEADDLTQAFTYRIPVKDYGRPDHPYRLAGPPPGYDPAKYRWGPVKPIIPHAKLDLLGINWGGDLTGHGTRWVMADWEERARIEQIYRNHDLGWLYYIQTQGGSPEYGLPDDEFTDNGHFPYRLYVRQGRRIEGLYTMTESDLHKDLRGNGLRGPLHADSVAVGVYLIDAHHVQNPTVFPEPVSGDGAAEGTLSMEDVTAPYQISYGVMVPKNRRGLLFPVGVSSTHVAMTSIRMEPVWSALGHAAGIAAALALDLGCELDQVPVAKIQDELLRQRSLLFFYTDLPGDSPAFTAVQQLSLRGAAGDLGAAELAWWDPAAGKAFRYPAAYRFRPADPITRGEFARMLVKGLQIPLSITAAHFSDVPRGHPAFKYLETIYDSSTSSSVPFFDFEVRGEGAARTAWAHPDATLTEAEAIKLMSGLRQKPMPGASRPDAPLTRGDAARLIHRALLAPPAS